MITEKRLESALSFLSETDEQNAEANANVKYLDRLLKRKKALYITGEASLKSISAKEQAFYASDTYKNAVDELFQAEVKASTLENKRDKEGLIIDIFRTLEASRRKNNILHLALNHLIENIDSTSNVSCSIFSRVQHRLSCCF